MSAVSRWEQQLPPERGILPLGGLLRRTDPNGACPAPVAIVGLYPALTRTARYTCKDGSAMLLPVEVEARSFEGSKSASELATRYLEPLGLVADDVFLVDLYPYYLANTAGGRKSGRSMWDNVQRYHFDCGGKTAVEGRPNNDSMVERCRNLPGNADRLAHYFDRCRPALVITLGNEVAAFARGYTSAVKAQADLYAAPTKSAVFGTATTIVHGAHPGLFIRGGARNPWLARHAAWCADSGRALVADAKRDWRRPA